MSTRRGSLLDAVEPATKQGTNLVVSPRILNGTDAGPFESSPPYTMSPVDRQFSLGLDYADRHQLTFELTELGREVLSAGAGGGLTHIADIIEDAARRRGFEL